MSTDVVRPDVQHMAGAAPADRDLVEKVASRALAFERGMGQDFKERCEHFYRQYRGFKKFRNAWESAGPNDRDAVVYDAKKHWGANLHIPLSFRTIETMVPRAIAQRPRMLYLPRHERWQDNVENVRLLIDSQQEQIDVELTFQDIMRAGMIYGIGWGKSYWRTEWAPRQRVKRRVFLPGYKVGDVGMEKTFDDPDIEDIDVFDVMWDPLGSDVNRGSSRCRWIIHRVWLDLPACLERVRSGAWNTESAKLLTEDKLRAMGNGQKWDEIWHERMAASGFSTYNQARGEQLHEVWEAHDGNGEIITLLDRQVAVQQGVSQCVGMLPFHAYRPTRIPKQMIGIGELEPVEHLQRELDTLRSQRRDAATLALCAGYAYDDGAIEEEDLVWGPNAAIRVTNARPGDAIMPLPRQDVPGSAYQDEQAIRNDFDGVTGINDALAGGDGGAIGTATEAQLVQAALSKRIEMKSRRFEVEVVRQAARCFLYLDQRMIVDKRDPLRQPGQGLTVDQAADVGRWQWFPIGPEEIAGEFHIIPEGGSMAAENVPQMRQDAQMLAQLDGNPYLDPKRVLMKRLQLLGIKDPESWLKQEDAPIPPMALKILSEAGVPGELLDYAVQSAQSQDPRLAQQQQQGPDTGQVAAMMGDQAPQPPEQVAA
jgi:hypothetical protein